MTSRLKDPDIARLFENTFPNTLGTFLGIPVQWTLHILRYASLDTTIKYFNAVSSAERNGDLAEAEPHPLDRKPGVYHHWSKCSLIPFRCI